MKVNIAAFGILFLFGLSLVTAQDDNDLGTETVTVIKPYSPSVSDAEKIPSVPVLDDSVVTQKRPVNYKIFSVPVASTFSPAKGKATPVQKVERENIYNSYAAVALGNYSNALVDIYTSRDYDRGARNFDIGLTHHSSRGNIDDTPLNADFYKTALQGGYSQRYRDWNWKAGLGLQHKLYNWYGLPVGVFDPGDTAGIDEKQNYFNAEATAVFKGEDMVFQEGTVLVRRFWDAVESGENRAVLAPSFEFPISDAVIELGTRLDYLDGKFANADLNSTVNDSGINYRNFQVGLGPSILILRDALSLKLGAKFVYGLDVEASDSNFYVYPDIVASYILSEDLATAYGGVEGSLVQNSYHDFVAENPFVSPTLTVAPTDRQYQGYLGLRGKLLDGLSYNIKGFYQAENNRAFFRLNPINIFRTDDKGYGFGNSFQVVYDDLKTFGFFGELNLDLSRKFALRLQAEFNDYNTASDNPAWNLPTTKGSLILDYQISKQWYLGANLFYVGERLDLAAVVVEGLDPSEFPAVGVNLESFFDANVELGYRLNDQLTLFAKGYNLANNQYERWANFRVQGFQVLAGASYQFDF